MRFFFALLAALSALISTASHAQSPETRALRIAIDRAPETLNPRRALDAIGQQIGSLIFASLVHIDDDLKAASDLADTWGPSKNGLEWRFKLKTPYRLDHSGQPIHAENLLRCFENYRNSAEKAPLILGLANWKGTKIDSREKNTLVFELGSPDPYFDKNSSLLRYFVVENGEPCQEPKPGQNVIASGRYKPEKWANTFESKLRLNPIDSRDSALELTVIKDEGTRVLALLKNDIDALQNGMSLTKTRYVQNRYRDRFNVIERDGVNVTYLAFNNEDPILKRVRVRQAIAHAIDRKSIVEHKMFGFGTVAESLLSPLLPEALQIDSKTPTLKYDLELAKKLLDEEGFKPDSKTKTRLTLRYRTTPVREGIETALMVREMLSKVGINVQLDVVEPGVFLTSLRKGHFQLYSSRYIGISDASILERAFKSKSSGNRFKYRNESIDRLLDRLQNETSATKRIAIAQETQKLLLNELPILPLWFWNNAIAVNRDIAVPNDFKLSMSGAIEPLARLKPK